MIVTVEVAPTAETFVAARGPFSLSTALQPDDSNIIVSLPFWTSRETLKLFTELYLKLSNGAEDKTPANILAELILTHSPFQGSLLPETILPENGLKLWTNVPPQDGTTTKDELRDALRLSLEDSSAVLFDYDSEKAEGTLKLAGKVHKLDDSGFTVKSGSKYRTYDYRRASNLTVINGRSVEKGIPALRLLDRSPEEGGLVTIELGSNFPWAIDLTTK